MLLTVIETGEILDLGSILPLLAKVAFFFAITIGLGKHVYPHVGRRLRRTKAASLEFSILMGVALSYCLLAELLDMHWIIGAFVAGLFFDAKGVGGQVYKDLQIFLLTLTSGFLGPLFFISIGMHVDLEALIAIPVFTCLIVIFGFLGKLVGAGIPARLTGLSTRNSMAVGVGMSARGAVELILLGVTYQAGIFTYNADNPYVDNLFSALVFMAVMTTLLTPLLLRRILKANDQPANGKAI
ncbi:MAG: cation:proton antiporter [Pusillimonas sp.]|nr:cation:proton antiporter [Pusillimonas sp.]